MTSEVTQIADATDITMKLLASYRETVLRTTNDFKKKLEMADLSMGFGEHVREMTDEEIQNLSIPEIKSILIATDCDPTALMTGYYNSKNNTTPYLEYCKDIFRNLKREMQEIVDAENKCDELESQQEILISEMKEFLDRPENKSLSTEKIAQFKNSLSEISDETERNILMDKISHLEEANNFQFLLTRLNTYGKKEADSIWRAFFKDQQGGYVLTKYRDSLRKLGINAMIHTSLFNLEEILLPENYHPFNNFFLFHVMRYIAYIDRASDVDKLYVSSILTTMRSCATGTALDEEKTRLRKVMTSFYTFFDIYDEKVISYFKEHNASCSSHPERIAYEKRNVQRKRSHELARLKADLGKYYTDEYEDDMIYDDYGDIKDLSPIMSSIQKEKEAMAAQVEEFKAAHPEVINSRITREMINYEALADASIFINNWKEPSINKEQEESDNESGESEVSNSAVECAESGDGEE